MRFKKYLIGVIIIFLCTSCREYFEFEFSRFGIGFVLSLVIGLIGLIAMAFGRNNKD
jgi:hypothetical protein